MLATCLLIKTVPSNSTYTALRSYDSTSTALRSSQQKKTLVSVLWTTVYKKMSFISVVLVFAPSLLKWFEKKDKNF